MKSRWTLPGPFTDYRIVRALAASAEAHQRRWLHPFVTSHLDVWLSSPFDAETLYDLYEALGGHRPVRLTALERRRYDERLKRCLLEAFARGRLVVLELTRIRPSPPLVGPEPHSESE